MPLDPVAALDARRRRDPDGDAVIAIGTRLSAGELWDSSVHCARLLREHGVTSGSVVGVELPGLLQPVFALALWMAGAVGAVAPAGSSEHLADVLDVLVTGTRRSDFPGQRQLVVDARWLAAPAAGDGEGIVERDDAVPARIVFSSGTTGAPKAIPFAVADIAERVQRGRDHWMRPFPVLTLLSLGTISGAAAFFAALEAGEPYLVGGTGDENARLIAELGVTTVHGSPSQLADLVRANRRLPHPLASVSHVQSVGSPLSSDLESQLARELGAEIEVIYGATEVGAVAIRRGAAARPGDVGDVLPAVRVEVVGDGGSPRPGGEVGLVRILSTLRERERVLGVDGDGWFTSGDVGRMAGGRLTLLGRADDILNAAGVKVDPERIEQSALEYPGVSDAAAVAVRDGRGVAAVALVVVADRSVELSDLLDRMRTQLGDGTPRIIERVEELPRTENGKLRRGAVADALQQQLDRDVRL